MGASLTWPGSRGVPEPLGRGWVEMLGAQCWSGGLALELLWLLVTSQPACQNIWTDLSPAD